MHDCYRYIWMFGIALIHRLKECYIKELVIIGSQVIITLEPMNSEDARTISIIMNYELEG